MTSHFPVRVACMAIIIVGIGWLGSQSAAPMQPPSPTTAPAPTSTPWVPWYKNPDALAITLTTDKPKYNLGDDVLVKIQETNTSNDAIEFGVLTAYWDYDLYLSHGTTVMKPLPAESRRGCSMVVGRVSAGHLIAPQATRTEPGCQGAYTPIADWGLKISEPGKYYLVAMRVLYDPTTRSYSKNVPLSNTAEITVAP